MEEKILNAMKDLLLINSRIDCIFKSDDKIIHIHKCKENKSATIQFGSMNELNVKYLIILTKNNQGKSYFSIDGELFWIEFSDTNIVSWEENLK